MPQKLLIIIPCYNEEASLPLVLADLNKLQLPDNYEFKVVVVNDCSYDRSDEVLKDF